ncbi:SH3 domain-containing protein [Marinospirillum perlucidum]|uniref:SH3 domain-containing protein n=1 Tax=Marinospirillum perlucidum TaxID=1982602 RepID=UPI001390004E|nr:SH3 domain-containing protein [Marinospirillum perlucidum]
MYKCSRQLALVHLLLAMALFSLSSPVFASNVWMVAVPVANVRAAPQGDAALVTQLPRGEKVTLVGRQGVWLQVELPDNQLAWMHQVTVTQAVDFFGLSLQNAERSELREAIKAAGVEVVREVSAYPYDLYNPAPWWTGATEMAVGYTPEDQMFAIAEITFRSQDDTEQVREIAEQVQDDLGDWDSVSGRRAEGPVEFEWQQGGVRVLVHRGWPDTTTYLTYEIPERFARLQAALQSR